MERQIRKTTSFGPKERRAIIEEYLASGKSKAVVWQHYTGQTKEKGQLLRWMKQLGYVDNTISEDIVTYEPMSREKKQSEESVEELKARVKQLERQLEDSQIKEEAYRRMIDIAEKELKISIRKKSDTK